MGKFTDHVRRLINPVKQRQIDWNRQHGLKDNARFVTIDKMRKPHDAYFIRLTDDHTAFVKFKDGNYFIDKGSDMACLFDLNNGTAFIESVKANNLELVRLSEIIKQK